MRIAIAHDEAFNFQYRANIDALRELGEVIFFSPLRDAALPSCSLLYLPGGYPELFAEQLSANTSMRASIKAFAEADGHVYAECGGFMYLTQDIDGIPMCGVLPPQATMQGARLHLGYRQMQLSDGTIIRGHEFHYSSVRELSPCTKTSCQQNAKGVCVDTPIYHYKNVIAGYTHWYWAEQGFNLGALVNP
ncbi:MAG: hypothetical protein KBT39_02710 [Bacteroidales bacterium]|nr:hypothetical protein [Bacteroidales bacterium]